jgi:hypothetical protein
MQRAVFSWLERHTKALVYLNVIRGPLLVKIKVQ